MTHVQILLLRCVCWARRVTAFPDGQVEESCQSMAPNHTPLESQISSSPYKGSIHISVFNSVTLQVAENASEFQGFMLQAREINGKTAVGCFTLIKTNQSRALNCFNIEVLYSSADKKSQSEATWEAPANSSLGDIQFLHVFNSCLKRQMIYL
uniref:Reelin domain-containing protein n=1 Tax=Cyprinus carpio carpio TaxID=630221 RepID=A0A9J8CQV5_CYPCA